MSATAAGFVAFGAGWAIVLVTTIMLYRDRAFALRSLIVVAAWLLYVGTLSRLGIVAAAGSRPPGIVFIVVPLMVFVAGWAVRSESALALAMAVPVTVLVGLQVFRVGVELFLHRLWVEGLVPRTLTFEGDNVDLWIGLSAPLVAWLASRGKPGLRVALLWNIAGLATLANVVVRSALTSPGPLHLIDAEVTNRAIGTFPYTFIAGFLAPSALVLHVLCLRAIGRALRGGPSPRNVPALL